MPQSEVMLRSRVTQSGAEEMAQGLRVPVAPVEDQGLVVSTHSNSQPSVISVQSNVMPSGLQWYQAHSI